MRDEKPVLLASIDKYTRTTINGHVVLMRADALNVYKKENKLYDYGILIRIDPNVEIAQDLTDIKHPSIKMLYTDPDSGWEDPFVNGANSR